MASSGKKRALTSLSGNWWTGKKRGPMPKETRDKLSASAKNTAAQRGRGGPQTKYLIRSTPEEMEEWRKQAWAVFGRDFAKWVRGSLDIVYEDESAPGSTPPSAKEAATYLLAAEPEQMAAWRARADTASVSFSEWVRAQLRRAMTATATATDQAS